MLRSKNTTRRNTLLLGLTALFLSACAGVGGPPPKPEDVVKQRATERWEALIKRDFKAAYQYAQPSYRKVSPLERFEQGFGSAVTWKSAEVLSVSCEAADRCTARVRINVNSPMPMRFGGTIATHVSETWLLEEGQWWMFQQL